MERKRKMQREQDMKMIESCTFKPQRVTNESNPTMILGEITMTTENNDSTPAIIRSRTGYKIERQIEKHVNRMSIN